MFRRLREKIEQALASREASRPISRDDLDRLLHAMREELIEMRARIPRLEKQAAQLETRVQQEVRRAERAHQLAQDATAAGREAEARSAMDAAERALRQAEDLKRESIEAQEELAKLKIDTAERMEQLKDAERNRSALLARSRRAGTARQLEEALRGPESGLKRFERAEEDLQAAEDLAAASDEVEEALGTPRVPSETDYELRQLEAADEMEEIERRLAELKREVRGQEG